MKVGAWASAAMLGVMALTGCGGSAAKVTGTVTCGGNPVPGSILFSPLGVEDGNKGPAVTAQIRDDGTYDLRLTTTGKHTVVISPRDRNYPAKPGEFEFPCDLAAKERDVTAGHNQIDIELTNRKR